MRIEDDFIEKIGAAMRGSDLDNQQQVALYERDLRDNLELAQRFSGQGYLLFVVGYLLYYILEYLGVANSAGEGFGVLPPEHVEMIKCGVAFLAAFSLYRFVCYQLFLFEAEYLLHRLRKRMFNKFSSHRLHYWLIYPSLFNIQLFLFRTLRVHDMPLGKKAFFYVEYFVYLMVVMCLFFVFPLMLLAMAANNIMAYELLSPVLKGAVPVMLAPIIFHALVTLSKMDTLLLEPYSEHHE